MSNFVCPTCGMTNIDCGHGSKGGYKTPREIELEKENEILQDSHHQKIETALREIKTCEQNYTLTLGRDNWYARQCLSRVHEILKGGK